MTFLSNFAAGAVGIWPLLLALITLAAITLAATAYIERNDHDRRP